MSVDSGQLIVDSGPKAPVCLVDLLAYCLACDALRGVMDEHGPDAYLDKVRREWSDWSDQALGLIEGLGAGGLMLVFREDWDALQSLAEAAGIEVRYA